MSPGVSLFLGDQTIFVTLLSIRLINALTVRTFFQPDEYYQALEPAWNLTYHDHSAWITWEWHQGLRSAIHPAIFSIAFKIAGYISPCLGSRDSQDIVLLITPKIVQAIIAGLGDYYTWKLSNKVYVRSHLSLTTLCLTILNPWQWFCSTRTFSNGLENTLTIAALYNWPLDWTDGGQTKNDKTKSIQQAAIDVSRLRRALVLAAIATLIRPTNILIWLVMVAFAVSNADSGPNNTTNTHDKTCRPSSPTLASKISLLARESFFCGSFVLVFSLLVDRVFYGVWTFPPLNFLYFNVARSLAVFYGNNDWHYYLSQGYPLLLTTILPFTLIGFYRILGASDPPSSAERDTRRALKSFSYACIALPAILSILSHKEVRFIYPIIGLLHIVATEPAWSFVEPIFGSVPATPTTKCTRIIVLLLLLSLNLLIGAYTSTIHNSGLVALPDYFRNEFTAYYSSSSSQPSHSSGTKPRNMTVAFLMPCHSVPWRSHLLHPANSETPGILAWALTCEPPLHITDPTMKQTYQDEADIFYLNPSLWLRKNMSRRPPWKFATGRSQQPHRPFEPGVYAREESRNKQLWGSLDDLDLDLTLDDENDGDVKELDITTLLPFLQTRPGGPAPVLPGPPSRYDNSSPSSPPSHPHDRDHAHNLPKWITSRPWPHYLSFFAHLEPSLKTVLRGSGYVECWRRFNSHWHDDRRRTGDVVVWCLFPERAVPGSPARSQRSRSV